MMFRVILFIIAALFIAFAASWLAQQDGVTSITWLGFQLEISTSFVIVLITLLCVLSIFTDRIVRALIRWPSLFSAGWQARRRDKGELALSLGFVALAAGDNKAASKQARRAEKLLDKGILTDLLVAQASYASGDSKAASRYFKKLANEKQTAYFGQLGLMRLYQQDNSPAKGADTQQDISALAYAAAEKAFALDATSAEAAQFILRKALQDRHWGKAVSCLKVYLNQSGGQSEKEINQAGDLYARLSLQMAQEAYEADDKKQAISLCEQALTQRPDFVPAAHLLVTLLQEKGDKRGAQKQALKAFLSQPNQMSLNCLRDVRSDNDGQFITYATTQAAKSTRPDDALLAVTQYAISVGIWASASQVLAQIQDSYPRHSEYFMVQADIAQGLEDEPAHKQALRQAASAPRAGSWHCQNCQSVSDRYEFDCASCGAPGQMTWQWPTHKMNHKMPPATSRDG